MRRGFKAAKQAVEAAEPGSVGDLFKAGGSAIIATSGGASGVIFGLFLRAPAKQLSGQTLTRPGMRPGLRRPPPRSRHAATRSRATRRWMPSSPRPRPRSQPSVLACWPWPRPVQPEPTEGKDDTVEMIASFGKAKALGERAKGHPDPGALSTTILLDAARDYVKGQS